MSKPCKRFGHTDGRTKDGRCVVCHRAYTLAYRKQNAQRIKEVKARRYRKTRATVLARVKEYALRNAEKIRQYRGSLSPAGQCLARVRHAACPSP